MRDNSFTLPNMLPPREDELLYNYAIRLGRINFFSSDSFTLKYFFGEANIRLDSFLPLKSFMGISDFENPLDIFMKTSVLPVFLPFLDEYTKLLIINYLFNVKSKRKDLFLPKFIKESKLCPLCAKEDEEKYGSLYLHRSHQVIGVNVCYKHKVPLYKTKTHTYPGVILNLDNYEEIDSSSFNEYEERYARLIYNLLNKPQSLFHSNFSYGFYEEVLGRLNYLTFSDAHATGNKIHWRKVMENFALLPYHIPIIDENKILPYEIIDANTYDLLLVKINDKKFITTTLGLLLNKHSYNNIRIKLDNEMLKLLNTKIKNNGDCVILQIDSEKGKFLVYSYRKHEFLYLSEDELIKEFYKDTYTPLSSDNIILPGNFVSFEDGKITLLLNEDDKNK